MNSETFRSFAYASLFKPAGFELCNTTSLPQCMGESSKEGADEGFVILCGNRSNELTIFLLKLTQFLESFQQHLRPTDWPYLIYKQIGVSRSSPKYKHKLLPK